MEVYDSPWFEILFVLITITAIILDFNNIVLFTMYSGLCLYICACFKRMCNMVSEIDNKLVNKEFDRRMGPCIDFHNKIFKFVAEMESWAQYMILMQLLVTSSILCFILFQLTAVCVWILVPSNITEFIYLISIVIKFYIFLSWKLISYGC